MKEITERWRLDGYFAAETLLLEIATKQSNEPEPLFRDFFAEARGKK